ncbi:MAG: hypothetical protein L7H18_00800 [Candidatus Nealsonbacteria bacterium DGGOD1a]|jgi:Tfp pilus assembly protein PilN|nr:MAG: hypothetical protein L7H18_00800 [Candidatus Nealsonbacteria bacterium DGGOD1a]
MINLLPQYWQNKLRQEEMSKIAAILGIVAVFSLVLFIFMLALVRVFYYAQLESGLVVLAEKERQMAIFNVEEIEKQAVDRGNLASKIADFYAKQIKVTEVFTKVAATLPPGVVLSKFGYVSPSVYLEGYSPDRAALVIFKENLEKQADFKKMVFPPENWLTARDIKFGVNFEYAKP